MPRLSLHNRPEPVTLVQFEPGEYCPIYRTPHFPVERNAQTSYIHVPEIVKKRIEGEPRSIMTGKVEEWRINTANPKIGEHLALAKRIIQFVNEKIHFSSTYPNRSLDTPPLTTLNEAIYYIREPKDRDELEARSIEKKIGNCYEMARIGLRFPELGDTPIETITIRGGDHTFLVIGRDPTTEVSDISSWNPEAVICDPWSQSCYPAKLHEEFLRNYTGLALLKIKSKIRAAPTVTPMTRSQLLCPIT